MNKKREKVGIERIKNVITRMAGSSTPEEQTRIPKGPNGLRCFCLCDGMMSMCMYVYLKIVNYHSIHVVFLQKNLKSTNPTSKNQVFDCFSVQEDFHMHLSQLLGNEN